MRQIHYSLQRGYFLFLALILIFVIGALGMVTTYLFANRANLSVAQLNGLRAFYIAESGLEASARLLTMPNISGTPTRIACSAVSGNAAVTNTAMGTGTFTATTINSSPIFSMDNLSTAETISDTTINVTSTSGFAPTGRLVIDKENIDYSAISGNSFIGVTRGVGGTVASSHASGADVTQYQCSVDVVAGIPSAASPQFKRELRWDVQLQEAWAVGNFSGSNFIFTKWNRPTELAWTAQSTAGGSSVANLNGISMLSAAYGWAVGNMANNSLILLRWNGTSWQLSALSGACSGQHLRDVSMVSSQEGWAVGARYLPTSCASGSNRYTILRWNGSAWSRLTPSTSPSIPADNNNNQNLMGVHVIDTGGNGTGDVGFAVGLSGRILRYNGTTWTQATSPTSAALNGVYVVSNSEAWAVGANGVILRWNGSTWSSVTSPTTTQLNRVAMLDVNGDGVAEFGVAVGNSGRIATYNGSSWSVTTSGSNNLLGVSIIDQQDAWAVGNTGTILHWNGSAWAAVTSGTASPLNGISFVSQGLRFAAGWRQVFN